MATVISYEQWMKETHSLTSPRSELLKKVDAALKNFSAAQNATNRDALRTAFDLWRFDQSRQGKDWRKSVRNEKGAVTNLYRALCDVDKRQLTPAELEAMQYISRAQTMALQRLFDNRTLQFKSSTLMGLANGAGSKWQKFKTGSDALLSGGQTVNGIVGKSRNIAAGANILAQGGGKAAGITAAQTKMSANLADIKNFIQELCPGMHVNQVFAALHLGTVEQFAVSLSPFVGAISSGGKALIGWGSVAKKYWDSRGFKEARYAFAPDDPEAAFDAVLELVNREIQSEAGKAATRTAGFTGKALGFFADGSAVTTPVFGLLEILADVFQAIVEYVRDIRECELGSKLLQVGALNLDLFKYSPILGCYFLLVQDHSTIINFAVGEYGTTNWMFDVERLVAKIQPVLAKAQELVQASRMEVPGLGNAKGVVAPAYSKLDTLSKVTGAPGALKDKIGDMINGWFEKPEKPPTVDKSRIVGIAYNA